MKGDIELSNTVGDSSQNEGNNYTEANGSNYDYDEEEDEMMGDSGHYHNVMEFSMDDDRNDTYYDEIFAFEDDLQQSTATNTIKRSRRRRKFTPAEEERLSIIAELKRTRMLVCFLFVIMGSVGFYFGFYSNNNNNNNINPNKHQSSSSSSKEIQEEIVLEDDLIIGGYNYDQSKASHQGTKNDASIPEVVLHDSTTESGGYEEPSSDNEEEETQSPLYSNRAISTNFADTIEPYDKNDLPIFWHVPKAGGTFIDDILGNCFSLVEASQEGITIDHHDTDTQLEIVTLESGAKYVNVDVSTPTGIERAKKLDLVNSHMADVALTSYLKEIAEVLFDDPTTKTKDSTPRGRCFTLLRHPVRRAVSMFYYLQIADWEETYHPKWQSMTLEDYASSIYIENDWMTRMLVGKISGDILTDDELQLAKDILKNKCLIGILDNDHLEESLLRFETYFKWNSKSNMKDRLSCQKEVLNRGGDNSHSHPHIEENSDIWNQIAQHNVHDLELFHYALELYEEQTKLFQSKK